MTIPVGNDTTGASGTGPVSGCSLKLMCFILFLSKFVLILNTCTYYVSLTKVMKLFLYYMFNFAIKICLKLPSCLTLATRAGRLAQAYGCCASCSRRWWREGVAAREEARAREKTELEGDRESEGLRIFSAKEDNLSIVRRWRIKMENHWRQFFWLFSRKQRWRREIENYWRS